MRARWLPSERREKELLCGAHLASAFLVVFGLTWPRETSSVPCFRLHRALFLCTCLLPSLVHVRVLPQCPLLVRTPAYGTSAHPNDCIQLDDFCNDPVSRKVPFSGNGGLDRSYERWGCTVPPRAGTNSESLVTDIVIQRNGIGQERNENVTHVLYRKGTSYCRLDESETGGRNVFFSDSSLITRRSENRWFSVLTLEDWTWVPHFWIRP